MTQAPAGGPAQTTYRVTDRALVTGRAAQRVFVVSDSRPIEGGPQQAVYYVSDAEIAAGEFVISGNKPIPISEVGAAGATYPPIAVYVVTAASASDFPPVPDPPPPVPDPLLDLEADMLALSDGDPVALWADQSGNGYDFTQTGSARPTKQTVSGYTTIRFDGIDDFMDGQNWPAFDNPETFTVFVIATTTDPDNFNGHVIYKITSLNSVPPTALGWGVGAWGYTVDVEQYAEFYSYMIAYVYPISTPNNRHICATQVKDWNTDVSIYVDGIKSSEISDGTPPLITSIANSVPLRLGTTNDPTTDGYSTMDLYAVRFYSPALSDTDRAAVEAELATRYGITL